MPLSKEDLEKIDEYVKSRLAEWLSDLSLSKPPHVYEIELRERMVRVEEELKNQRELMKQGFDLMDKRFVDMQNYMDKRFEDVNTKFKMMFTFMSLGFTVLAVMMTVFKFIK
jgi:hypothetical protein